MARGLTAYASLILIIAGSGCNPARSDRSLYGKEVTLKAAVLEVQEALDEVHKQRSEKYTNYLVPTDVDVTFVFTASRTSENKLVLEGSPNIGPIQIAKAGVESKDTTVGTLGNTVVLKFRSLIFAPKDVAFMQTVKDLPTFKEFIRLLRKGDGDIPPGPIFVNPSGTTRP